MTETAAPELEIRREAPEEHRAIHDVEARAFGRAEEADLVDVLRREADPHLSLVALQCGELVAHVFFSPVELAEHAGDGPFAALGPIGVEPARHGEGIGSQLVRAGLVRAREMGWRAVFLVGNPAYYGRFGFQKAAPRGFTYGQPHFDPALQWIELEPGALEGRSGLVRFHSAFGQAEAAILR